MSQLSAEERLQIEIEPHANKNMVKSVAEGVLDAVAAGMIPLNTVVTYFISDYVNNSFLIGLLPTLQAVCNVLVQLIAQGVLKDLEEARRVVADSFEIKEYTPDAANAQLWQQTYQNYLQNILNIH